MRLRAVLGVMVNSSKRAAFWGGLAAFLILMMSTLLLTQISEHSQSRTGDFSGAVQFEPKSQQKAPPPQVVKRSPPPKPKMAPPKVSFQAQGTSFGLKSLEQNFDFLGAEGLGMGDLIMTEETVDVLPKRRGGLAIEYPQHARSQGIQGLVLLRLLINSRGAVEKAEIRESRPSGVFDNSVLAATKAWSFEPAIYQGRAVAIWVEQKVNFDLN